MWSYIARRLLIMIPTLFGITIVSFTIMQLAPGDPLRQQLGQAGASGLSTQTRDQYLVQKRDLNLDKPILLNFRYFRNYREVVRMASYYRSLTIPEIREQLPALAKAPDDPENARRLRFLKSIGVKDLRERLNDPKHHERLALAINGFAMIFAEDIGKHGVPAAIDILRSDAEASLKIGAIRCLGSMVLDPYAYTYSRDPLDEETPLVAATWKLWWERNKTAFAGIPAPRREQVRQRIAQLASETSYSSLLKGLEGFSRADMPVFAETLLGESSLREKMASSLALNLYVGKPLKIDVPLNATQAQVDEVAANWVAHYDVRRAEYEPGFLSRLLWVFTDTQYAHMVWRLVTFDFGRSALPTRDPVGKKIWDAVLVSAPLMLLAQALIYLMAVPLGIFAAVKKGKFQDRAISLGLFLLYSIPSFVAGMLFLVLFCYGHFLKIFPMEGLHSYGAENYSAGGYWFDYLWHIILPVVCLSLFGLAGLAMYSRTSMLDVVNQDFVRTARAKGLPERKIIFKHALRNALIPIITLFANFIPAILGGSVLIEYIFNIPGMGRLSFSSIEQKDFPTLMALIYVDALLVMISILLSDILYAFVDPRISFEGRGKAA